MEPIDLDTTRQQDLYRRACQDMAARLPGWTDEFPSDPAVAILEHLTYLSDVQNYALNQMEDAHYLAYCKLLGTSPRALAPAWLLAQPDPSASHPWGSRFFMDHIPFEVDKVPPAGLPQIEQVSLTTSEGTLLWTLDAPLSLDTPLPGQLTLHLSGPLPAGKPYSVWFSVIRDPRWNPPSEETVPPVTLRVHCPSARRQNRPCTDGTCGFLQSGFVSFTLPVESDTVIFQMTGGWEGRPQLSQAVLEPVKLVQRKTRSAHVDLAAPFSIPSAWMGQRELFYFVPCGDGWKQEVLHPDANGCVTGWSDAPPECIRVVAVEPDFRPLYSLQGIAMEEIQLQEEGVWPDALQVMVEENGVWYDFPVCRPVAEKTLPRGCRWVARRQVIRFGDGRDYLPPAQGRALIADCVCTMGRTANGAMGPLVCGAGAALTPLAPAQGGQDAEAPKDAFLRAAQEQEEPLRAVTCQDYERLARRASGLALEQVRALPRRMLGEEGPGIILLAKPSSGQAQPTLTLWQQKQLTAFLAPYQLLGVPLEVRSPRYCPIQVRGVVLTTEPVQQDTLYQAALLLTDGVTGPLDFGAEISYTALYAALGSVEHVRGIHQLELTALTDGVTHLRDGSIQPAPDMLPYLAKFDVVPVQ